MDVETKPLTQPAPKSGKPEELPPEDKSEPEKNGNTSEKEISSPKSQPRSRKTRSRSRTPAKKGKKSDEESKTTNTTDIRKSNNEDSDKPAEEAKVLTVSLQKIDEETNGKKTEEGLNEEIQKLDTNNGESSTEGSNIAAGTGDYKEPKKSEEHVEMDPLVLATDEPDPELQFDENSDMESGKGSPVLNRCKTRRSQNRNVPTPKTPKSIDSDSDKNNSVPPTPDPSENDTKAENLNDTNDSPDVGNSSTKPQVGSDVTRMEYTDSNSLLVNDDSYLNESRERSLSETLRSLSARRSIRPISDNYRKKAFKNAINKTDLNLTYPSRRSVESVTTGVKRKGRSITPEETKKFKSEPPGLGSLFTSPINNLRNKLRRDAVCSTPKLTGYKDDNKELHEHDMEELNGPEKTNWCTIM